MNNTWVVEYYSNDYGEWDECSPVYLCLDDAIRCMREQAEMDPDMTHRVINIVTQRTTVALSAYGEELVK